MKHRVWPHPLRFLAVVLLIPLLQLTLACEVLGSDEPVEEHDDSFTVTGAVTIDVESFNGSITATGSDTNTVRVQATLKRADHIDYSALQFGNSIQVSANERDSTVGRSPSVTLVISGPSNAILVLRGSNGSVNVSHFDAGGTLRTSNGRVTVDDLSGDLKANTSNGSINVTGHTGSADLTTSNGTIAYSGTLVPGSDNGMNTSNGSITVELKGQPSLKFNGSTSNGSVTSDLQMLVERSGDTYLEGVIGTGAASLTARTSNGSIKVR